MFSTRTLPLLPFILFLSTGGCQPEPYSQGEVLYKYHCENCHMEDGSGLGKLIPPLDSSRLTLSDPVKLVCLIRNGLPVNKLTGQQMPANLKLNEICFQPANRYSTGSKKDVGWLSN